MILQSIHGRLTPTNCAIILMDYQPQFAQSSNSADADILLHNGIKLAKIAKTFSIPTLLTTIGQSSFGGPVVSGLQKIFPHQETLDRTTLSVFEDARVLAALEKTGRNKLVIAGLWTDFGVAASVWQARQLGYEVFMVVDACGDVTLRAHAIAIQRLCREGAVPMTWLQMLLALHRDWAPPEAYDVLFNIAKDHASAYGLEMQYTRVGWMNDKRDWQMTGQEKGGGQMLQGSGPITKQISKKTLTRHHLGDHFENLMKGEFFNGGFKKSFMLCHESPNRKQLFPSITG